MRADREGVSDSESVIMTLLTGRAESAHGGCTLIGVKNSRFFYGINSAVYEVGSISYFREEGTCFWECTDERRWPTPFRNLLWALARDLRCVT